MALVEQYFQTGMFFTGIAILIYISYGFSAGAGVVLVLLALHRGGRRTRRNIVLGIGGLVLIAVPVIAFATS